MFGSGEVVVVIAVIMLMFGSSQIPKLAKNLGAAQKELKAALSDDEPQPTPPPAATVLAPTQATVTPEITTTSDV